MAPAAGGACPGMLKELGIPGRGPVGIGMLDVGGAAAGAGCAGTAGAGAAGIAGAAGAAGAGGAAGVVIIPGMGKVCCWGT